MFTHEASTTTHLSVVRGRYANDKLKIAVDSEDFDILHPFEWGVYPLTMYHINGKREFRVIVGGFHRDFPKMISMSALIRLKYNLMVPGLAKLYMIAHPTSRKEGDLSCGPSIINFRKRNFRPGGPSYFEPTKTFQEVINNAKEWYGDKAPIFDVHSWFKRQMK